MQPRPVARHTALGVRRTVAHAELRGLFDTIYPLMGSIFAEAGVVPTACRAYYFADPVEAFDVAPAFVLDDVARPAVEAALEAAGYPEGLGFLEFPAGEALVARFEGSYDQLGKAWDQFAVTLHDAGLGTELVNFEDYVLMPGQDGGPVTDLYWYV